MLFHLNNIGKTKRKTTKKTVCRNIFIECIYFNMHIYVVCLCISRWELYGGILFIWSDVGKLLFVLGVITKEMQV